MLGVLGLLLTILSVAMVVIPRGATTSRSATTSWGATTPTISVPHTQRDVSEDSCLQTSMLGKVYEQYQQKTLFAPYQKELDLIQQSEQCIVFTGTSYLNKQPITNAIHKKVHQTNLASDVEHPFRVFPLDKENKTVVCELEGFFPSGHSEEQEVAIREFTNSMLAREITQRAKKLKIVFCFSDGTLSPNLSGRGAGTQTLLKSLDSFIDIRTGQNASDLLQKVTFLILNNSPWEKRHDPDTWKRRVSHMAEFAYGLSDPTKKEKREALQAYIFRSTLLLDPSAIEENTAPHRYFTDTIDDLLERLEKKDGWIDQEDLSWHLTFLTARILRSLLAEICFSDDCDAGLIHEIETLRDFLVKYGRPSQHAEKMMEEMVNKALRKQNLQEKRKQVEAELDALEKSWSSVWNSFWYHNKKERLQKELAILKARLKARPSSFFFVL